MLLVYLDRQHAGKPTSPRDRGAWGDLSHDGQPQASELEAMLTAKYLLAAEQTLIEAGAAVLPLSDGAYYERHSRVARYGAFHPQAEQVYVAAHLNAGGGDYGAIFYDRRSTAGKRVAELVVRELSRRVPEIRTIKVLPCSQTDSPRAWSTISGIWPTRACGICYEPYFVDGPQAHVLLTAKIHLIGEALARGILAAAT